MGENPFVTPIFTIVSSLQVSMDDFSFGIEKLQLQGAVCSKNELKITNAIVTDLHIARLRWLVKSQPIKPSGGNSIHLPVYLNSTRYFLEIYKKK